jgi:hypothetical protein
MNNEKTNNLKNSTMNRIPENTKFQRHLNPDKFLMSDLEKELLAAEKFLNKNANEILKSSEPSLLNISTSNVSTDINKEKTNTTKPQLEKRKKIDPDLIKYQKQLKSFDFPEIGNFYFPNSEQKEITLKFFDFLILKKSTEHEEKMKFKKQIEMLSDKISTLHNDNSRLEKEIINLAEEIKKITKEKKDCETKLEKLKETSEKQISDLKGQNLKLTNRNNAITTEKKAYEEKLNKLTENYQKIINKNNSLNLTVKANNHIEMIESLKRNDVIKVLSKVKGTEKLIETFKNGFNESLRELLFEISGLKNFIYEIHQDLILLLKKTNFVELEYNLLSLPFLDTVNKIKTIFKKNFKILDKKLKSNKTEEFNIEDDKISDENTEKIKFKISSDNKNKNKEYSPLSPQNEKSEETESILIKSENNIKGNIFETFEEETAEEFNKDSLIEKGQTEKQQNKNEDYDYEDELEFLKNKWIKTLMSIKNQKEEDN